MLVPALPAQAPSIERVRIGLPVGKGGAEIGISRNGEWTPVAVTLKGSAQGNPQGAYRLRVESADAEELKYLYTVEVPALAAGAERTVQAYAVPGGDHTPYTVRLETAEGRLISLKGNLQRDNTYTLRDQDVLFLTLGSAFAQMKRAAEKQDAPEAGKEADSDAGQRKFAFVEDVDALPDQWFGYAAVDAVVLSTRDPKFVTRLAQEGETARRTALLEWVRRGGQLILSVGSSRQEVARELLPRLPLIDVKITGSETLKSLPVLTLQWARMGIQKAPLQNLEVTTIVPGKGVHSLVRDEERPILLEASCGLGRVILVAFDLEDPKFSTWDGQSAFWTKLQQDIAPHISRKNKAVQGVNVLGTREARNDLRDRLRQDLETFEEITPIPFGYVAVFILLYIMLVGPLDYFVLKKVFKRLELTWVTFPATVIGVSLIAYFAAYSVKGQDLRTNKIDLIDVDLHEPKQVYGQTWFTLFSPRVQAYTIGLESAVGVWTDAVPAGAPGPTFSLLESDEPPRTGAQGMFTRPFEFATDATGLRRVPVPVWATRTFGVSWRAPLPKKPWLDITDDGGPIRASRDGRGLVGKLTNRLEGVTLKGVSLFYRNKWYTLGDIAPDEFQRLEPLFAADAQGQGKKASEWIKDPILDPGLPLNPAGRPVNVNFRDRHRASYLAMQRLMFFRSAEQKEESNVGMREFDQSWRLAVLPEFPPPANPRYRDEAILVARTQMLCDNAEAVTAHPSSPSRLWLGSLPADGGERPAVPGVLTQETYLRVFIPVE